MIGSILSGTFIDENTIVWGSGNLNGSIGNVNVKKVCAVRGPKTRDLLLKRKINCPAIYGDPALLIPYYYYPYVQKKYKLGIIPHHTNINNGLITKFKNNKDVTIIDFTHYDSFQSVVKRILECEFILSESLHGLIISEAFRIPNMRIIIRNIRQDFKYQDWFASIKKPDYIPYTITDKTTINDLLKQKTLYNDTFDIDLKKLVNACPFKLINLNMENKIKKQYMNKVLLCCIGKMENNYIREYVEHYKSIGFDNICLYDNNDPDGEHFEDVIGDYIDSGFVILKDVRGQKLKQIPSYTECYNEYKDEYDWIAFFDIDEFLHIDNNKSIKEFLSDDKYNNRGVNCVRFCWKQFDDSGIIETNGNYSVKKFTSFLPLSRQDTTQSKIIIKTVLDNVTFTSTHGPIKDQRVKCVNTEGALCQNAIMISNSTWKNACLYHYRFKTLEEYINNKMVRLWPTAYKDGGKSYLTIDTFFKYNKKTPEKENYIKRVLKQ